MSSPLTMLSLAETYLAERRRLGFALTRSGGLTLAFARFADASGHEGALTSVIVLRWAKDEAQHPEPFTWAGRVNVVRPFARFLTERVPGTVFPEDAPFGRSHRRLAPHIYTLTEVEALRLSCGDLDERQEQLTVRHAKFQRTRLVPLHPTVGTALRAYLPVRARYGAMNAAAPVFLSGDAGQALRYESVRSVFLTLAAQVGIVARGGHRSIRIHDLRHSFICRRLMLWQADGDDVGNAMMALVTYVGHVNVGDTYWYLQAVPELMAVAVDRFEAFGARLGEVHHG